MVRAAARSCSVLNESIEADDLGRNIDHVGVADVEGGFVAVNGDQEVPLLLHGRVVVDSADPVDALQDGFGGGGRHVGCGRSMR